MAELLSQRAHEASSCACLAEARHAAAARKVAAATHPARLFSRSQAIAALSLAERRAAGFGDNAPRVIGWREELFL